MTRVKIIHKRVAAAAEAMKHFGINDHDWDTTPMRIRQLLMQLAKQQIKDKQPPLKS